MPINLCKKFRGNVAIFISKSIFSLLATVIFFLLCAILDGSDLHRSEFGTGNDEQNTYLVCQKKDGHNVFCNRIY